MNNIKRIGIDLAKQVFQLHGVDQHEKAILRKQLRRNQMLSFFSKQPSCLIGMEACSSSHYWARELQKLGHTVKLMAPQFVKPYVKSNKNALSADFRVLLQGLYQDLTVLDERVADMDKSIQKLASSNATAKRLQQIPGIGPITATALVCAIGNGKQFKRGRDLAAWLGLTPRQHSSGGKECLLSISKRGDSYLRTLLIHGARAVLRVSGQKEDPRSRWLQNLCSRRNKNIAAVALANKNTRVVWALLTKETDYQPEGVPA